MRVCVSLPVFHLYFPPLPLLIAIRALEAAWTPELIEFRKRNQQLKKEKKPQNQLHIATCLILSHFHWKKTYASKHEVIKVIKKEYFIVYAIFKL